MFRVLRAVASKFAARAVALRSMVDVAVETARPAIDAGKHTLTIALPSEPLMLDADALRISQVLANLLTNAAKYTEHRGTIHLGPNVLAMRS